MLKSAYITTLLAIISITSFAQQRARDLGIRFEGKPGRYNAITDVKGVLVGYKTLIKGDGALVTGKGPVRTGVTVIMPNGKSIDPVPAGWFCLNGDGEMTGTTVIEEYGLSYGPIGITNTNSVGVVRDAIGEWNIRNFSKGEVVDFSFGLPVVAETFDGVLNDINGLHVKKEDVFDALNSAHGGKIEEGNVGGGTGMMLFNFKGGSGTSSRVIKIDTADYTIGVFVQGNFGTRKDLIVSGVPVGRDWKGDMPVINAKPKDGSIIIIIGTDAPLLPAQLKMIAKRASLGVARCGGLGRNGSGDIFLAFSTVAPKDNAKGTLQTWVVLPKEQLDKVYQATVDATEEAIINAMVAAKDMKGINGNTAYAIPHDKLMALINGYSHKTR
ncbi:DmpA family aminopeptidase [Mucilaginibacter psychrotolerans]|uniref:S58 family peptidase n=1 Tax=Mucilaginibacter psychrotolerans TaxID=1524096 RepID=A0A4Y8S5C7_9SPHI|nr:P1 family peptidase [Mucilaginibacter psychrotolerans]TFF33624.1 S58 family peptidase [Mucilaginibacter psychrotolerans]